MSRRKLKLFGCALAGVVLVAGAVLLFSGPSDPVIQGKRLSFWITEFNIRAGSQPTPAANALAEAGTKAESLLRNMLRVRDASWEIKIKTWLTRQKFLKYRFRSAAENQAFALGACNWLGKDVQGTVPALAALVNDFPKGMKDRQIMDYALHTLAIMGTNGVTALKGMMTHPDAFVRAESAWLLGTAALEGNDGVIAALQERARNGDAELKAAAVRALELIEKRRKQRLIDIGSNPNDPATGTPGPLVNLWSVKQGVEVTGTSGLAPTFQGEEIFEGRTASVETGTLIFRDSRRDGFTHFVEWSTPQPVTIRSFGFLACHEGGNVRFQRAFREFRLSRWDEAQGEFKPFHDEYVPVPHGDSYYSATLMAFRILETAVVAQRFRLEVVQHGNTPWAGPRLIELYGFDQPVSEEAARNAIRDQTDQYRKLKPSVARLVEN